MDTEEQSNPGTGWCLVVPVKLLHLAKSRLSIDPAERSVLALAFAADTVAAALRTPSVVEVVVVTDDATAAALLRGLGAEVVSDEPDAGLNPALRHGAAHAAARHPGCGIGALSADLPALRMDDLERALSRATTAGIAVVPDTAGSGTTAYFVVEAESFAPAFGKDSLRTHLAAGARALATDGSDGNSEGNNDAADDLSSLRQDVDTQADLAAAVALGVGTHTANALKNSR